MGALCTACGAENPETARFCNACGSNLAPEHEVESQAQGERRLVTVLFADISGSTAAGEKLDPEALRNLITGCFDCLVPHIVKHGGTVDKFVGDEIMALFGAPVAHENDVERALRASLEMREAMRTFNEEWGFSLAIHSGINTGLV